MRDMGDYTRGAKEIADRSYKIVSQKITGDLPEDRIIKRAVIATGDFSIKDLIVFKNNPINAGKDAIKRGYKAYCDVEMIKAGINRYKVKCVLSSDYSEDDKNTRTASGFYKNKDRLDGSIIIIGNAPSAAIAVSDMVKEGIIKPVLIIATPVGFVNAAESKEYIRSLDIPSITTVGTRGGSTMAVAIFNGLIDQAIEDERPYRTI
ncbi:MAG: precorrin-8X methylmutase [Candidatus Methanoliparum thermophilum]|uniref:Precorrin-8X methylmutase n=1 Tax=Methanoliparum thermophilum TaxID=2491083 RepID=A0A520KT23_METT2|nr:precorrin-8X methylmutase [Candidatus Methanoliparum sp. LAM-1]RZN65052.1 MAG: precorrin-8X methylmutase [Candidatus Methanoliparum thermophilum]BDC36056.1 precorrin-8X methylmutase [Candidatus Methanoliparum sp. LAM-1]